MRLLRAVKHLLLGETWILPLGVAAVLLAAWGLSEVLGRWETIGGFMLLIGVLGVLLGSVGRAARRR